MLVFQFPLIVYALLVLGVVSLEAMRRKRRWIIVIILIIAGILSPPDVASQVLLALPCYLLFEAALWIYSVRGRNEAVSDVE
jgi:sec-independent protein translocase protein TatC